MRGYSRRNLGITLLLALACFRTSGAAQASEQPAGRLTAPEPARVVVEKVPCDCESESDIEADVLLVTLGTESWEDGKRHFHPVVSLAFDRLLAEEEPGQWVVLWNLGVSSAGWRRTLRAFFPFPVRPPKASEKKLAQLTAKLEQLRAGKGRTGGLAPAPYTDLSRLKPATASHGTTMALKRVLNWVGVFNPAQLVFRTFLLHRKDRAERTFQRTYLGLGWVIDAEFDGAAETSQWLKNLNDVRFHLLRERSFFGRWVRHADSLALVYNYDNKVRENLAKGSSWLQAVANEYHLHYEPIHRFTVNGATVPAAGVLYYDPRKAPLPERARWLTPNVFDLGYNPFTLRKIQRRARENPEQLIPLALYVFQSELGLRPIIVADFFASNNPRLRETAQQGMEWLREWLVVSTGFFSVERLAYRVGSYIANRKAFTLLVNKSARLGVEELRLALESHLYFDSEQRHDLMQQVDKRVQNPLVKAAPVEALRAALQYEGLRADGARAVCQAVNRVRRKLARRFQIPDEVAAPARWVELRGRLAEWQVRRHIRGLLARGFAELGALAALEEPLAYFEKNSSAERKSAVVLRDLYAALFWEELQLPPGTRFTDVSLTGERVARLWARLETAHGGSPVEFERERARVESATRARLQQEESQRQTEQVRFLREFLEDAHAKMKQVGCGQSGVSLADVEMYLEMLQGLPATLAHNPQLAREFRRRHARRLQRDLARLQQALAQCPPDGRDPWQLEQRQAALVLARAADERLFAPGNLLSANGEEE
ncbi:MAG: hypothetical protein ACE5MH_07830 [Terriglobia bacterium]